MSAEAANQITIDEYTDLCRRGRDLTVRIAEHVELGKQLHSDVADYTACVEMAGWLSLIRPDAPSAQVPAAPSCADLGEPPAENGQLLDTLDYSARRLDIRFF